MQLNTNTTCAYACQSGQYVSSTSPKQCLSCSSNCVKCATDATHCTFCGLDGGLQMYLTPTYTCNLTCPEKYFRDTLSKSCVQCHSTCYNCTGSSSSSCTSCSIISGQQYYLRINNSTCGPHCTTSYFIGPDSTFLCDQCDISCLSCTAANTNTACLTCNELAGYNLA